MIQRLYVHNYRCLVNFELKLGEVSSAVLLGRNGAGKSTICAALGVLQQIARGTNRVNGLVKPKDFWRERTEEQMHFEVEVLIEGQLYKYKLSLELPEEFRELRVCEESLSFAGKPLYSRQLAQVEHPGSRRETMSMDWHLVALPILHEKSEKDPLSVFKRWLRQMLLLSPIPTAITGESQGEALMPERYGENVGEWFAGMVAHRPASYSQVFDYLKEVMPDLLEVRNPVVASDVRSLQLQFGDGNSTYLIPFRDLSDGEKCFFFAALVLAANKHYGPVFCFWDEPDNYLAYSEVRHFVLTLRKAFESTGQILMTSHNPEALLSFASDHALLMHRKNHLSPTQVANVEEIDGGANWVDALRTGELEP